MAITEVNESSAVAQVQPQADPDSEPNPIPGGHNSNPDSFDAVNHGDSHEASPQRNIDRAKDCMGSTATQLQIGSKTTQHDGEAHAGWTPLCLRRFYLLGFAVIFILMIVALELLHHFSQRNQGLVNTKEGLHYLWKYGPTFVITLIAALWGQVTYRVKQLMPWRVLAGGRATASESLLLDYLSPSDFVSLFRSLKAFHSSVVLAVLGSFFLQGLIVSSTALLDLQHPSVDIETNLVALDRFNFNTTIGTGFEVVDDSATVWGIKALNLPYPEGTTDNYATQTFMTMDPDFNGTITGLVDVFSADLECEPFEWAYADDEHPFAQPISQFDNPLPVINAWSPSCHVQNFSLASEPVWDPPVWSGEVQPVSCSDDREGASADWFLISLSLSLQKKFPTQPPDAEPATYLRNLSGLLCKPTYLLTKSNVSIGSAKAAGGNDVRVFQTAGTSSQELSLSDFSQWMIYMLGNQADGQFVPMYNPFPSNISDLFTLLNQTAPQTDMTGFCNNTVLASASRKAFRSVAAQLAKHKYLEPTNETFTGIITISGSRLYVEGLSLRLMEGLLAVLILTCLALALDRHCFVSRDPGSIAGFTAIMARSPDLAKLLVGTGDLPFKVLGSSLQDHSFATSSIAGSSPFCINVLSTKLHGPEVERTRLSADASELRWWRPPLTTSYFRVTTVIIPLAIIVVLEVLYGYSVRHNGITDIDDQGYAKYAWLYVPAFVMVGVSGLFRALDFTTRSLHPYQELSRGRAKAQVILHDPFGKVAFHALCGALTHGYIAVSAVIIATILAPILAVAVSGLYSAQPVPVERQISISRTDGFDLSDRAVTMLEPTAVTNLIMYNNLSFPQWTYDELVFPKISISTSLLSNSAKSSLSVQMPAIRTEMNCTAEVYPTGQFTSTTFLTVPARPPNGCHSQYENSTQKPLELTPLLGGFIPGNNSHFAVQALESAWDPHGGTQPCGDVYQHMWFLVGHQSSTGLTDELSVLYCVPYVESVAADVTFTLPDFQIDKNNPPFPKESSAKFLSSSSGIFNYLPTIGTGWYQDPTFFFDGFFMVLTHGFQGIPIQQLVGRNNTDRLLRGLSRVYGQYVAQAINFNHRTSQALASRIGDHDFPANLTGTITNPTQLRLLQSKISTRILDGILAILAVCAAVAWVFLPGRNIVANNPHIIATCASLLAGSKVLDLMPEGAEWYSDAESTRSGVFKGLVFSLRWWDRNKRFGIDFEDAGASPT